MSEDFEDKVFSREEVPTHFYAQATEVVPHLTEQTINHFAAMYLCMLYLSHKGLYERDALELASLTSKENRVIH